MSEITARTALITGMMAINQPWFMKLPNSDRFIKANGTFQTETPSGEPWLRLTLLAVGDEPITLSSTGYNRRQGLAQISVFTPKGQPAGDLAAMQLADEVRKVFKTGAVISGVRINSAATSAGTDEENWYSRIINVDFYYYTDRGV